MKKRWWDARHLRESMIKALMQFCFLIVAGSLGLILFTVAYKGLPALTWEMLTQAPEGGFYLGREGGVLNAILGSLYLATGGTVLAAVFSLPMVMYLQVYQRRGRWGESVRLCLDVLWGVPSIVYGAFGFIIMLAMGVGASLLGGILALAFVELPIMTRAMDEVVRRMPRELEEAAYALGSTRLEVAVRVVTRQMLPGIITAVLLAFGRGIGDAASVLFTAGYTDRLPSSLFSPVASLPLAVFFQLGTPFPEVQQRGYASALILTIIVLAISFSSRWLSGWIGKYSIK